MPTPRLFVSHAHTDVAFAQRLADNLRQLGADVWLDTSHIGPGDFVGTINKALQNRDQVILILTPAALASDWVQQEVNAAIARINARLMKPLIVIMAEPTPLASIPPLWNVYHRYDATHDYGGALYGIASELGLTIPRPQKPINALPANTTRGRLQYPWLFRLSLTGLIAITFYLLSRPFYEIFFRIFNFLFLNYNIQNIVYDSLAFAGIISTLISIAWAFVIALQQHERKWSTAFVSLLLLLGLTIVNLIHLSGNYDNTQSNFLIALLLILIAVNAVLPVIYSATKRT